MLKIILVLIVAFPDQSARITRTPMSSLEACANEVASLDIWKAHQLPAGGMISAACEIVKDPLL